MSDYRNDDENKELTSQTVADDHKTEEIAASSPSVTVSTLSLQKTGKCCRKADRYAGQYTYLCRLYAEDL